MSYQISCQSTIDVFFIKLNNLQCQCLYRCQNEMTKKTKMNIILTQQILIIYIFLLFIEVKENKHNMTQKYQFSIYLIYHGSERILNQPARLSTKHLINYCAVSNTSLIYGLTTKNSFLSTIWFPSVSNMLKAILKPDFGSEK